MDRNTALGGSVIGVVIRLVLISIVVGIVLDVLGITPDNLFDRLNEILGRIYRLGFGAFEWVLRYLVLGAMVVVPIWLIARLISAAGRKSEPPQS